MPCIPEMEDEPLWRVFFQEANEADAGAGLNAALRLESQYRVSHVPTAERMARLYEIGQEVYTARFGHEWMPF